SVILWETAIVVVPRGDSRALAQEYWRPLLPTVKLSPVEVCSVRHGPAPTATSISQVNGPRGNAPTISLITLNRRPFFVAPRLKLEPHWRGRHSKVAVDDSPATRTRSARTSLPGSVIEPVTGSTGASSNKEPSGRHHFVSVPEGWGPIATTSNVPP